MESNRLLHVFLISLLVVLFAHRSVDGAAAGLSFLVLGDWGGQPDPPYTTEAEVSIAKVMGDVASTEGTQFTLALGDNFYDKGVKDVNDPRFNYTFEVKINYTEMINIFTNNDKFIMLVH